MMVHKLHEFTRIKKRTQIIRKKRIEKIKTNRGTENSVSFAATALTC